MDLHMNGKVAVVTGGSKGIGLETARYFLAEGAKVAITARKEQGLELAAKELGSPDKVFYLPRDMTNRSQVYEFAEKVYQHFGRIDFWVNNVGASGTRVGMEYSDNEISFVVNTCFKSAVFGCQAAFRYLKKQGGGIVNVSSLAARCPSAGRSTLYGPMKAAIVNLTQTMAGEYCAAGVRVNCVMPGFTVTPLVHATISEDELEYNRKGTLLHRLAKPIDIAGPIVFLASDVAGYMTGTAIEVSGGRSVTLNPEYAWKRWADSQ